MSPEALRLSVSVIWNQSSEEVIPDTVTREDWTASAVFRIVSWTSLY